MTESIQKWLGRNRPPRVQITYDVETGGAIEMKELPFIAGILSDLSGDTERAVRLKERKFIEIDRDNFDQVMGNAIAPTLQLTVPDELAAAQEGEKAKGKGGETNLVVNLTFETVDDFRPESLAAQVPALQTLLEARNSLRDLAAQIDLREGLEAMLLQIATGSDDDNKKLVGAAEKQLEALEGTTKAAKAAPEKPAESE